MFNIVAWGIITVVFGYMLCNILINNKKKEVITVDVKFSPALLCILEDLQHLEEWKEVVDYSEDRNRSEEVWTSPKGFVIREVWVCGAGSYTAMTPGLTSEEQAIVKKAFREAVIAFKHKQQRDKLNKLLGVAE